jgi:hypothetical protein
MKPVLFSSKLITTILIIPLMMGLAIGAQAADNQATGDVAGDGGDLDDSNIFTIDTLTLALVKAAFLTDGTQLSSGDTLASGTEVQFLVYIDNPTAADVDSVNVVDPLTGFTYVPGTIQVDSSQSSGTGEGALYTSVSGQPFLDDGTDGTDVAGVSGNTVSAGHGTGNDVLTVPGGQVWAMLFKVTID